MPKLDKITTFKCRRQNITKLFHKVSITLKLKPHKYIARKIIEKCLKILETNSLKIISNSYKRIINYDCGWQNNVFPKISSVQFSSVAQSCPTLGDPVNHSVPGLPVHHQLPEFTQTHAHQGGDAIQPSHPLSYPSSPAPNPSQHQGLFQRVNPSHEVAKVLGFQLQHQSF